jgi:histidine triad (HIT) family protein
MDQCLFCRILKGELPAECVYEDDHAIAFLDIHPRAPGHTVVIPKEHAPTLMDLSVEAVPGLFLAVQKVARAVKAGLAAPGLTIGMNQGKVSGQEVDHLHVHILSRFVDDHGGAIQSIVNNPPVESLSELKEKIQSHL